MAHTQVRMYIDSQNGYGITHDDMRAVLGVSGNTMGQIVKAANINVNCKRKPVRSNILGALTDAQRAAVNYGLRIPSPASLSSTIGNINSEEGGTIPTVFNPANNGDTDSNFYKYMKYGWWYQKPRGKGNGPSGADEWFRWRDFCEYYHDTGPIFTIELPRSTVDGGDFYVDLYTDLELANPDYASLASLANSNGLMFLVAVVSKTASSIGNTTVKFKSAPTTLYGSTLYSVVKFTSAEVGNNGGITNSRVFVSGAGDYYVYGFLVSRAISNVTPPIQNLNSGASGYVALNTITSCIPLPCQRMTVTAVDAPLPNPLAGLVFTLASGGTITYNATRMELTVNFPQLQARSTGGSFAFILSNLYVSVYAQKTTDSSHRYETPLTNLGKTGTVNVGSTNTTLFSSATISFRDTYLREFVGSDNFNTQYARSAMLYYKDSYNNYWYVATLDINPS